MCLCVFMLQKARSQQGAEPREPIPMALTHLSHAKGCHPAVESSPVPGALEISGADAATGWAARSWAWCFVLEEAATEMQQQTVAAVTLLGPSLQGSHFILRHTPSGKSRSVRYSSPCLGYSHIYKSFRGPQSGKS